MEPKWITIARTYLGTKEGVDDADNPVVVGFYKLAGHPEVKHDAVPWCAAFVGAVLALAGIKGTGTLWALDYSKWGQKLKGPALGAIATKTRNGGGHVFFVVGWDKDYVYGLGGNQGDAVSIVRFPRSIINSYTWPSGVPVPTNQPTVLAVSTAKDAGSEA